MTLSIPPNSDDAAFITFVMVDELVDLLVGKGAISSADAGYFYGEVAERLRQGEGPASKRASQFI
jgi:polyhydroxyalkanoate synthesis regulator phasin